MDEKLSKNVIYSLDDHRPLLFPLRIAEIAGDGCLRCKAAMTPSPLFSQRHLEAAPWHRKGRPISNMAMLMTLRRMDQKDLDDQGKGWRDSNDKVITAHGFRSTFRDWAAECTHYAREVCEMSLAHVVANGAEAAYWRSDLLEKRRTLMADWADFVTLIVNGTAIAE
ncbi:hypothetical protein [Pseudomonas fluorescens]